MESLKYVKKICKAQEGSMAVEAALVCTMIIVIIVVIVNMTFIIYDKTFMTDETLYEYVKDSNAENSKIKNKVEKGLLITDIKAFESIKTQDYNKFTLKIDMKKIFKGLNWMIVKENGYFGNTLKLNKIDCVKYIRKKE